MKMLKKCEKPEIPEKSELKERLARAEDRLAALQIELKEKKIPVLVIFEGWDAAGKGSVLGKVIKNLDPRFFDVRTLDKTSEDELRRPFLFKYFSRIPEVGKIMFWDGGWMEELNRSVLQGEISKQKYENRAKATRCMERQLLDNGYLVLKFFFHIDQKEQRKRMEQLLADRNTAWRVSEQDVWQNRHYGKCRKLYDHYMETYSDGRAPWHLIDAGNRKWAQLQIMETLTASLEERLKNGEVKTEDKAASYEFPLVEMPKLSEIELDQEMEEEEYRRELAKCQKKLSQLHNKIHRRKIPVIIAYEGWDAAGKGGNIKRVVRALDPRGCDVHPIAAPQPFEKARHHLWRFCIRLPKTGHIAIFDRTWYGRVMVERLEGFCSQDDWMRAYTEINEFEKGLHDWGAVIIKFWVQIDKDTQLQRFTERQNTPEKQWKITDEDWRNREKWDQYETAVDEMIAKTSTEYAPWYILESNNKYYARIKALKIIIRELERAIAEAK